MGSIPAGNGFHDSEGPRHIRNVRELRLRLIDSNFPVLGLRPPLCCVYVAPLPAGSIRSHTTLTGFVHVARLPASGGLHSRRERFPSRKQTRRTRKQSVARPVGAGHSIHVFEVRPRRDRCGAVLRSSWPWVSFADGESSQKLLRICDSRFFSCVPDNKSGKPTQRVYRSKRAVRLSVVAIRRRTP